jgi:rRNA maturation endonuclease Nob1
MSQVGIHTLKIDKDGRIFLDDKEMSYDEVIQKLEQEGVLKRGHRQGRLGVGVCTSCRLRFYTHYRRCPFCGRPVRESYRRWRKGEEKAANFVVVEENIY